SLPEWTNATECVLPSAAEGSANRPSQRGALGSDTSSRMTPRSQYERYAVRPSGLSVTECKNACGTRPRHAGAHCAPVPTPSPASCLAPHCTISRGSRGSVTSTIRRSPCPSETSEFEAARYANHRSPDWRTVNSCTPREPRPVAKNPSSAGLTGSVTSQIASPLGAPPLAEQRWIPANSTLPENADVA